MADIAFGTEQVDGFEHVVQVVRRLAHAHEDDLLDRALPPRQHHLRQDLHAGDLADQAALAGHAESTADRAADLGGNTEPVARQQHAFHHLPVGQVDQQARAVVAGMFGTDARQAVQLRGQGGQRLAQRQRQIVVEAPPPRVAVERLAGQPGAHDPAAMSRLGAQGGETLVEIGVAHGERILRHPARALGGLGIPRAEPCRPYAAMAWASCWMDSGAQPSASLLTVT